MFLLTGCSSPENDAVKEERNTHREWLKTTYNNVNYNNIDYEELKLEFTVSRKVRPILIQIQNTLPEDRMQVEIDEFNNKDWFYKKCSTFVDSENNIITEPLPEPIIGSFIEPIFHGYASEQQIKQLGRVLDADVEEKLLEEHLLSGSEVLPEYPFKEIILTASFEEYDFTIQWRNDWNTYLWEGFYEIDDPGRWSFEEYPYPGSDYAPFTIIVEYTEPCEIPE